MTDEQFGLIVAFTLVTLGLILPAFLFVGCGLLRVIKKTFGLSDRAVRKGLVLLFLLGFVGAVGLFLFCVNFLRGIPLD